MSRSSRAREVVITGTGVCCHMGDDLNAIAADIRAGKNTPFQTYPEAVAAKTRCQLIGLYPHELVPDELGITKQQARFMGRGSLLGLKAARHAVAQAELDTTHTAVVVGSGAGDVETHRQIAQKLAATSNGKRVSPTVIPKLMASTVSANFTTALRATGPSFSATAACAGGPYNILIAAGWIRDGLVETAVAGGVEVKDIHFYCGFDSMRAYNGQDNDHPERASRPYAADRAGFIFSEGAGIVVLESRESADKRGAKILGSLRGYGMSSDGTGEMVAPSPNGPLRAMERALVHASLDPSNVDYVNTHGTSTPLGDVSEVRAIRRLMQDRHVLYSSTKGYTGHPVTAAGAIEAILTLRMLAEGWIAPSVNAEPLDPQLADYRPVTQPTNAAITTALSNSFGFGGTNVTLVLEKA